MTNKHISRLYEIIGPEGRCFERGIFVFSSKPQNHKKEEEHKEQEKEEQKQEEQDSGGGAGG